MMHSIQRIAAAAGGDPNVRSRGITLKSSTRKFERPTEIRSITISRPTKGSVASEPESDIVVAAPKAPV